MKKKGTLYNDVYNDIISKIKSGYYKVGEKLPTEMELTEIYGVSRITVSHAMKDLADTNMIYRVKRSGTFVNGKLNHDTPLVIPTILPFEESFNDIMKGIQNAAITANVFTPFYNSKNNIKLERDYLGEILKNNLDGLIVYPCVSYANIDLYVEILSRNIPVVCVDRPIVGLETPLVTTQNADCMCKIVNRLAELGHRKIGFFSVCEQMAFAETERLKGFCRGLVENKLPLVREYLFSTTDMHGREINLTQSQQENMFRKYVKREMNRYLELEDKPTAICCLNDSTLETVCLISKQLGIRIPEDLTVTGFDCVNMERVKEHGFISVRQNFLELGTKAISLMLEILNGSSRRNVEYVDGILIN